jgi:PadR family transcriptional regulator PadR
MAIRSSLSELYEHTHIMSHDSGSVNIKMSVITKIPARKICNQSQPLAEYISIICIEPTTMPVDLDWLRGSLQTILLQAVAAREAYGYEIRKRIRNRSGGLVQLNEGSLYPALHKLEQSGLLAARWEPTPESPRRKYYSITPAGLRQLEHRRQQWREFQTVMERLLGGRDVQPA